MGDISVAQHGRRTFWRILESVRVADKWVPRLPIRYKQIEHYVLVRSIEDEVEQPRR